MTFHPSDSCLQALGRDDPCYLSIVTSRAFWISTECCRVLLWSLHTSYFFFFLKKSQMSPSFVWGLLLLLFVAPIHNHIESDCAQYSAYSQKRGRAVTVQKSPQSLIGVALSSMCQRRLELGVLARNEDLTCEAPCAGTSQIHSVPSRRPSATWTKDYTRCWHLVLGVLSLWKYERNELNSL